MEQLRIIFQKITARLRRFELTDYGKGISHQHITPLATYSPWADDAAFTSLYQQIKYHTLVDVYRCYELYMLGRQVQQVPGNILEVGVWKGGTAKLLRQFISGTDQLFLADTFTGVVKASDQDSLYRGGEHADTSEAIVRNLLGEQAGTGTVFLKGIFPDDTGQMVQDQSFKLVHIDVDTHNSARDTFNYVWPQVIAGGIVVFDDYGFNGCEGVTHFFNELVLPNAIKLYNLNGHGVVVKHSAHGNH